MADSNIYVDNPLALTGLFGGGVYLPPEKRKSNFPYQGNGVKSILLVIDYPVNHNFKDSLKTISKIMAAVKVDKTAMSVDDYAFVNLQEVKTDNPLAAVIEDFKPRHLIIWSDTPISPGRIYYKTEQVGEIKVLLCHSMDSIGGDVERKTECWVAIKEFFGMM